MKKSSIPFDPSGVGVDNGNLYGFPFSPNDANVVLIPVPWDTTVSYSAGTAKGPNAILEASPQLDFWDPDLDEAWKYGISLLPEDEWIAANNSKFRELAKQHINQLEEGNEGDFSIVEEINKASIRVNSTVEATANEWLQQGKIVGVLGGEHSSPLGLMKALSTHYGKFGILQIDAHADLRNAYEGFKYSHASIMYNALQEAKVKKLVQVGIRDICPDEIELIESDPRIEMHHDQILHRAQFEGKPWDLVCREIVGELPELVYISFDIDGLDPKMCPNTGTPVPGGLSFQEAMYLIRTVVNSGRKIIGFDLCEVAPDEVSDWDANVGARVLYRLSNFAIKSQLK